jgi:hypothetical protein
MDRSHYLHVHIPGRGRVTLSLPGGIERAILSGRLPADAQVWHERKECWIPLAHHPVMTQLLQASCLPRHEDPPGLEPEELRPRLGNWAPPAPVIEPAAEPVPAEVVPVEMAVDPAQLPLIPLEDFEPHHEFSRFLARASEAEERRMAVRMSGPVRTSGPARVFVAGALELKEGQRRLRRLAARYQIPGWAAVLAPVLLSCAAVGFFFLGRVTGGNELPIPVTVTNALSAGWSGQIDSSRGTAAALAEPNPLAGEERELENNLRIAEAVVWQPAIDFAPEQVGRSSRKVDAVRNSISLYRVAAWRLIDSTYRDFDPRLEPYEEATRIDEVLDLLESAVVLLDSLHASFRVNGELLVFSDPAPAERYRWLRHRADSLIHTPLSTDSLERTRAPRRVVTRLVETLPLAVIRPDLS